MHLPVPVGGAPAPDAPSAEAVGGGTESILVVEDDDEVRERTHRLLARSGYRVVSATTGQEALEPARRLDPVDLVVTDVVMPGMDGFSLARRLRETWGVTRLLLMSGYAEDRVTLASAFDGETEILAKPVSRDDLLRPARAVLGGG